ncbi:hypothetical protein B9Z55_007130 [Caenorhabditis nigoni]|uniref:Uncharacterized protein n=1 Tax=Caenorhabditis nigoni TaxID=1611254 RepID=A0A2G5V859_9PELO|nr:hypothetical protein B9Z55_007130 [Caenorhabditis nigoni]
MALNCKDLDAKLDDASKKNMKGWKDLYDSLSPENQEKEKAKCEKQCEQYMESDSYGDGETDTYGYSLCCDMLSYCGGTSGWVIFLIILIVIGCLAAAGAAFYFFYWKRKMSGRDEEEKEVESGEDTTKSGYDISVDTY